MTSDHLGNRIAMGLSPRTRETSTASARPPNKWMFSGSRSSTTSAAGELAGYQALGHTVRLMPPAYVKPYVKRQKNDAADAEAICEAVTRANMRFVPTKTAEQQSGLVLHRARHLFIRQQTAVINAIRAHLPSSGSLHQSGVTVSRNCSMSSPIRTTSEFQT